MKGGLHAVTCKKLARHTTCHGTVEDAVLLMIQDALAIPVVQGKAAVVLADEKRKDARNNLNITIPITPHITDAGGNLNINSNTFGDILVVQNASLPTHLFPTNEDTQVADNDFTHRYTDMHSLWNEQLNRFLQHMTSPGNNGASYFFVDVHVSAGSINSVKAAAVTKHRKYREAWTRFCRDRPNDDAILTQYQQINHSTMGRPEVVTFGVNYDGAFDNNAIKFMARLAEIKYPTNPNNRSYRVSRQRWIVHYARQIQLAVANGAAPAISLAIRNIKSQLVTSSMESCGNLDKGIPAFRKEGNQYREIHEDKVAYASLNARGEIQLEATPPFNDGAALSETHDMEHISRNDSIRHTSVQSKTNTKTDKRMENSHDVVLQLPHSIADIEDSENSQLQSSPEMYSLSIKETQDVMSIVGREIQLTKDYTTGNATFKQGSRGTVIEATSRKDGKLKVKLDNDDTKTFRLIKECDLQLYEGVALSPNSESQTEEQSFEY